MSILLIILIYTHCWWYSSSDSSRKLLLNIAFWLISFLCAFFGYGVDLQMRTPQDEVSWPLEIWSRSDGWKYSGRNWSEIGKIWSSHKEEWPVQLLYELIQWYSRSCSEQERNWRHLDKHCSFFTYVDGTRWTRSVEMVVLGKHTCPYLFSLNIIWI